MTQHVITDANYRDYLHPTVNGERKSHGLIPRDWSAKPAGCYAFAPPFPDELLIPEEQWPERLAEQKAKKSDLLSLRKRLNIRSLDQNGFGYCWAFSSTKAVMYCRAIMGQPFVELSAWAVAAIIKNYRDQGGWGMESMEWIVENGVPSLDVWPQGQVKKALDTPEMRADAAKHKVTGWWEGSNDKDKATHQMVSAFLMGLPCVLDYDWWSHSVCGIYLESIKPLRGGIDNSWTNDAGDNGIFILEERKFRPDGLVIPRDVTPSPN